MADGTVKPIRLMELFDLQTWLKEQTCLSRKWIRQLKELQLLVLLNTLAHLRQRLMVDG